MATPAIVASATHKRSSSAAENIAEVSQVKRQAPDPAKPASTLKSSGSGQNKPQFVYVVVVESDPPYIEPSSDVHGVYATIKDANNAVKGIANNEYSATDKRKHGSEDDGRVYWSSDDAGEGEQVKVYIQVMELRQPGSEPEREWKEGEVDDLASGEECDEE